MPQSGILKTRVFTSRGQLPVEDAAVSIVQRDARRLGKPVPRTGSSLFPV